MIPEEKARDLYEAFSGVEPVKMSETGLMCHSMAKECCRMVVREIIDELSVWSPFGSRVGYWRDVLEEIDRI